MENNMFGKVLIFIFLLSITLTTFGQTPTANITGSVIDLKNAGIGGAVVIATNQNSGRTVETTTDKTGNFNFEDLSIGNWELTVRAPHFLSSSKRIELTEKGYKVNIRLNIESVSATVEVESDDRSIELQRVPGSTEIVTRQKIANTPAANLKDIFSFTPGVLAQPRFGSDEVQFSVRGSGLRNNYHSRGINIFINGMPYGDADGFSDFESLEFLTVRRVELWKGANALRFSGNTSGGALNIVTETGETSFPLEIRLQAGSFGTYKGYISTGGTRGRFGYFVGVSDTEMKGYREHSNQGRRRLFANFTFKYNDKTDLFADVIYANVGERYPGALTYEDFRLNPRMAHPEDLLADWGRFMNYTRGGIGIKRLIGSRHELTANFSFQYRQLMHPIFNVLDQHVRTFTGEIKYSYSGSRNRFVAGFVTQATLNGERRFENNLGNNGAMVSHFDGVSNNLGFFAENQFDITPKFTLVAGVRIDNARRNFKDLFYSDGDQSDERTYNVIAPKVGFVWRFLENGQLFANFSRSYEPPIFPELTSYGSTTGFLPLTAQDTWQAETGIRGTTLAGRVSYEIAFYNSEIKGEILNQNLEPFPGAPFTIPSFRNIPRSRHTGFELFADVKLSDDLFGSKGSLKWINAYTFSHFKFTSDAQYENNFIPGQPEHLLRSELRYDHSKGIWFAPNLDWSPKKYYVNSSNSAVNNSYAVLNLRMGFDRRRYGIFLEAGNLTDRNYSASVVVDDATGRFYEPSNGRSIQAGITYRFGH